MIEVLKKYPGIGLSFLFACAGLTILISSFLYVSSNKYLMSAKGDMRKGKLKTIIKVIYEKFDMFDRDNKFQFYNKLKVYLQQSGFFKSSAILLYLVLNTVVPIIFFILFSLDGGFLSGFLMALLIIVFLHIYILIERKKIENDWRKNGYRIYRFIHNQLSGGVSVNTTIINVYQVGIGTRLEKQLYQLSAMYGNTLNIKESLNEFKKYFKIPDIEMFCTTLEQGVISGDIENLIFRQEKTMFRQYFNVIQAETESSERKTGLIMVMLLLVICVMLFIPMVKDLWKAFNAILGN